jgi:multiple sugar transport system ATP-binding protein
MDSHRLGVMARVVLENLTKLYPEKSGPGVTAVNGINLTIEDREFMVLVGPSGCGKSTTLRMVAGLEDISSGTITIDGQVVNDVLPKDRDIAMVFQNYALYPHMSVYDNLAFGLKMRRLPKAEIDERVREAAAMLGLESLLDRRPKALSGGQRQRVAVGRAIVRKPKVFLFDEPLSNLDAKMRVSTRTEISKLHDRLGATMIYVTHDQVEAMTMGDRICVMKDGRIHQVAESLTLYNEPANIFVAGFIGTPPMNLFRGKVVQTESGAAFVESGSRPLTLALPDKLARRVSMLPRYPIILGIRPEHIRDQPVAMGADPARTGEFTVELAELMGAETYLHLTTGVTPLIARIAPTNRYHPGDRIEMTFNMDRAHLFDGDSGDVLR